MPYNLEEFLSFHSWLSALHIRLERTHRRSSKAPAIFLFVQFAATILATLVGYFLEITLSINEEEIFFRIFYVIS